MYVLAWQTFEAPVRPIPSQNPKNVRRMPWLPIEIGIFSIIMAGHARNKYAHQLLSVPRIAETRSVWVGSFHYPPKLFLKILNMSNLENEIFMQQEWYILLKYGFCKKYFDRNEHFCPPFFSRSVLITALIWKKMGDKSVQLVRGSFLPK